jgi:hypothetical protein
VSGRCGGLHCPGCGDGDGVALVAVLVALAVIAAIIRAIWHTIVEAAEIAALTVLSIAGLAAVAGLGYLALRVGASIARSRHQAAPEAVIISSIRTDQPPAIEPPQRASWPLPGTWEEIPTDNERRTS